MFEKQINLVFPCGLLIRFFFIINELLSLGHAIDDEFTPFACSKPFRIVSGEKSRLRRNLKGPKPLCGVQGCQYEQQKNGCCSFIGDETVFAR